jgi:hypothetical protein
VERLDLKTLAGVADGKEPHAKAPSRQDIRPGISQEVAEAAEEARKSGQGATAGRAELIPAFYRR